MPVRTPHFSEIIAGDGNWVGCTATVVHISIGVAKANQLLVADK